jgi:hypothetical protein
LKAFLRKYKLLKLYCITRNVFDAEHLLEMSAEIGCIDLEGVGSHFLRPGSKIFDDFRGQQSPSIEVLVGVTSLGVNCNHFSTIDDRATTLTREGSHCICNLTCLRVIFLDSSLSCERSLPFLTKNECFALLIL